MPDARTTPPPPTPDRTARRPDPSPTAAPERPLLAAARRPARVIDTDDGAGRGLRRARRRHRPGRHRRRARLRLPLLQPRLPHPAAPRGRRHLARSTRSPFDDAGPAGRRPSTGTEWILHAATQDLPCLRRGRACARVSLFDTELAGRLLGYPRVGLATLVETRARRQRMRKEHSAVDWSTPAAARAVAGVRRARRRGARRAARRAGRRARARPARPSGPARSSTTCSASSPPCARRGVAPYVRDAPGARPPRAWARCGRCGRPATSIAAERDVTPGRILPDSAIVGRGHGDARRPRRAAGDAGVPRPRRRALRHRAGSPRSARSATMAEADLPHPRPARRRPAAPAHLGRPRPGRRPPLQAGPRGDAATSPRSTACRSRTCSPPTTCAGCCGQPPATREPAEPGRRPSAPSSARTAPGPGRSGWSAGALVGAILGRRASTRSAEPDEPEPSEP